MMKENDYKLSTLIDIKEYVYEAYPDLVTKIVEEYSNYSLVSSKFILLTDKKKGEKNVELEVEDIMDYIQDFKLSFEVSCGVVFASNLTRVVMNILKPGELIAEDVFFYSKEKETVFYGSEAYLEQYKLMQEQSGKKLCPICDRYVPIKFINSQTGYCVYCNEHRNQLVFH